MNHWWWAEWWEGRSDCPNLLKPNSQKPQKNSTTDWKN